MEQVAEDLAQDKESRLRARNSIDTVGDFAAMWTRLPAGLGPSPAQQLTFTHHSSPVVCGVTCIRYTLNYDGFIYAPR